MTFARYLGALTAGEERQGREEVRDRHFWKLACDLNSGIKFNLILQSSIFCVLQIFQSITGCLLWSNWWQNPKFQHYSRHVWVTFLGSLQGLSTGRKARSVKCEMGTSGQQEKWVTLEILIIEMDFSDSAPIFISILLNSTMGLLCFPLMLLQVEIKAQLFAGFRLIFNLK